MLRFLRWVRHWFRFGELPHYRAIQESVGYCRYCNNKQVGLLWNRDWWECTLCGQSGQGNDPPFDVPRVVVGQPCPYCSKLVESVHMCGNTFSSTGDTKP